MMKNGVISGFFVFFKIYMQSSMVIKNKNINTLINLIDANKKKESINVMKRVEFKYILNNEQIDYLTKELKGHMVIDEYGMTSIASLYYDTSNYRLIRASIENPEFVNFMLLFSSNEIFFKLILL